MNCKKVDKLLLSYLDNEASPQERGLIEAHLVICAGCRKEMEALAQTQREIRQALEEMVVGVSPSPDAWATIKERLVAEEQHVVGIFNRWRTKLKGGIGGLKSPRPVWQTALVSALSVALIFGLFLTLPSLLDKESPDGATMEEQVASVVENDSQMKALLGDDSVLNAVVPIKGTEGATFYRATYAIEGSQEMLGGQMAIDAMVDLDNSTVMSIWSAYIPSLSEEQKQEVINIAKNDPQIDDDATVISIDVIPNNSNIGLDSKDSKLTDSTDYPTLESYLYTNLYVTDVNVGLEYSGNTIWALVDLPDGTVVRVEEIEKE